MRVRAVGVIAIALVGAAIVGGAVGYAIGLDRPASPATFAAQPVPASSPSYPVIPVVLLPDDPYPALEPGVGLRRATLGTAPFQVTVPVPRGWVRSNSTAGEWRWYPEPSAMKNVFFVRVQQVSIFQQTPEQSVQRRVSGLDDATAVDEFRLESRGRDRFAADYVVDEHRRLTYEGFIERNGVAYVSVAVIGREVDRAGLSDLFDRLMAGTRV